MRKGRACVRAIAQDTYEHSTAATHRYCLPSKPWRWCAKQPVCCQTGVQRLTASSSASPAAASTASSAFSAGPQARRSPRVPCSAPRVARTPYVRWLGDARRKGVPYGSVQLVQVMLPERLPLSTEAPLPRPRELQSGSPPPTGQLQLLLLCSHPRRSCCSLRASASSLWATTSSTSTPIATKRNMAAKRKVTPLSNEGLQTLAPNTCPHQQRCEREHKCVLFVLVAFCLKHRALCLSLSLSVSPSFTSDVDEFLFLYHLCFSSPCFSLSLSHPLSLCLSVFTRGRGLTFTSARVLVRARINGPSYPPINTTGPHSVCIPYAHLALQPPHVSSPKRLGCPLASTCSKT